MIIHQRSTFVDDFLLQAVLPYLDSRDTKYLRGLARYWNVTVPAGTAARMTPASLRPLTVLRQAWRKLARALSTATASA